MCANRVTCCVGGVSQILHICFRPLSMNQLGLVEVCSMCAWVVSRVVLEACHMELARESAEGT